MENYENKELLKEAAKQSLESLKDLKPGTEEYTNTAKMALQLYDMQLKSDEQESNQNLKEERTAEGPGGHQRSGEGCEGTTH